MMKALRVHGFDGIHQWALEDAPVPSPGPGQVQVRVTSNAISYVDLLFARGGYQVRPPLPLIPGTEFSGVITALGPQVGDGQFRVGQRVAGTCVGGAWAEFTCALADDIGVLPEGTDTGAASALAITSATALYALKHRAQLRAGETVMVLGAAGGVGLASVQVAKALGARVIAGVIGQARMDLALADGADAVFDTSEPEWRRTAQASAPEGIDVVVDPVGGALFEMAFRCLKWGGRHLVVGFAEGTIPSLRANLPIMKGASLVGVDIRQFRELEPKRAAANLAEAVALFAAGKLRPRVAARYPAAEWMKAVEKAQNGRPQGRVLLDWTSTDAKV